MQVKRSVWANAGITLGLLGATCLVSGGLNAIAQSTTAATLLFVLCVHIVARITDGYFWGIAASLAAVLCANFIFTFPYMAFNFTIAGYPLTFATMLAVSISTSAMTTVVKKQNMLRLESERARMRADLLRAVSHDLRTPLTSIAGSAAVLLENEQLPPESRRELLTSVKDDAEWLIRMVENLLSITRVGGENTSIQKSPEPAEEVVADAVRKFRRLYPDINVQAELPEDVLFVPMDAVLICQVFTNLLENAALHGGGTRNITGSAEVRGRSACFCVEDDGAGISENALPYLFEDRPSLRSAPADSGGRHNMGIGLSACRAIVKAHGGTMEAQNVPGRGARFCFTLPLDE